MVTLWLGDAPIEAKRHPSDRAWDDYAIANMSPGAMLAFSAHAQICETCSATLARARGGKSKNGSKAGPLVSDAARPALCEHLDTDVWRRLSSGLRIAKVRGVSGLGERVSLIRAAPGAVLPRHFALHLEWLLVLEGGLRLADSALSRGDLLDMAAAGVGAEFDSESLCLVVGSDELDCSWMELLLHRLTGRVARASGRTGNPPRE